MASASDVSRQQSFHGIDSEDVHKWNKMWSEITCIEKSNKNALADPGEVDWPDI